MPALLYFDELGSDFVEDVVVYIDVTSCADMASKAHGIGDNEAYVASDVITVAD